MDNDPDKTISFSGHRSFKMTCAQGSLFNVEEFTPNSLALHLEKELDVLYDMGYGTFLCGMAEGFDLTAAEVVIKMKSRLSGIRFVAVIPHPGQARSFNDNIKKKYSELIAQADDVITISEAYTSDCFHRRNDFLLENSSVLVCYYNGSKGGTAYTVKQALKRGMKVLNTYNP